jgi:hypothetical protein
LTAVRIAADFSERAQVAKLAMQPNGLAAVGLWAVALSWMHHAGTPIPADVAQELGGAPELARLLVDAGMWRDLGDGYEAVPEGSCGRLLWWPEPPPSRPTIPAEIRQAVFERDGHQCVECGGTDDLTLDHIYPWSLGGPDTVENLRVLCRPCNSHKGAKV